MHRAAQRDRIGRAILARLVQDGIDMGLPERTAKYRAERFYWGDDDYPELPGIREILYSDEIPKSNVVKYNQLNVMYMMGPDGKPWATPFARKTVAQAFAPFPHRTVDTGPGTKLDSQGKVMDQVLGINTGLHGIERIIDTEPLDPDDKMLDEIKAADFGKTLVPKKYRGGGGGGGGRGYTPQMRPLRGGAAARFDTIPMINISNPYIRRANVHRDRITSDRGRLKQWQ